MTFCYFYCFASDGLKTRMIKDEKGTYFDRPIPSYDHKEFVSLEVKSGSLVVIHGNLVHKRWSYDFLYHICFQVMIYLFIFYLVITYFSLFSIALRIFLQRQGTHSSSM